MPEPPPLARPLDQTGQVGDDELGVVEPDHAEVGLEGGERVVGDLGLGRRDRGDQRRLADAGEADERDVGHELELQAQPALLPHLALLRERRGAPLVGEEAGVAPAAAPALGGQPPVAGVDQVGQRHAVLVADRGALGHGDLEVGAALAVLALALPVGAAPGRPVRVVPERDQRRHVAVRHQPHPSPGAAVASVGPAEGHVGLPTERDRAGPAVAGLDVDLALVDELRHAEQATGAWPQGRGSYSVSRTGLPSMRACHVVTSLAERVKE